MTTIHDIAVQWRGPTEADAGLIFNSWLRSQRSTGAYNWMSNEVYYYHMHRLIEALWLDKTCLWLLAVDPEKPWFAYGYICAQRATTAEGQAHIVHFAYVRRTARRAGLGWRMLWAAQGHLTHRPENPELTVITSYSPTMNSISRTHRGEFLLNHFILWEKLALPVKPRHLKLANPGTAKQWGQKYV